MKETPATTRGIAGKVPLRATPHPSARGSPDLPCDNLDDLSPATTVVDLPRRRRRRSTGDA
jgi:hypothetical protein